VKIGFNMFLWTTNVDRKHEPILRDIKATGYDGVEIPIFEGTPDDFARLGDMLDRIGLERTAVTAMGDPAMNLIGDAAARKAGIAYMKWALDCCAALGAHGADAFDPRPVHRHRPDRGREEALRLVAARHRRSCDEAGRHRGA